MTRSGDGSLDVARVGTEANPSAGPCAADPSNGAPGPDALTQALELAREAAAGITAQFGTALDRAARVKVSRAFDRALPKEKRPRGRKRKAAITAAYEDWKAGMRAHRLYRKHIPGYSGMGRYRRECAQRRLNEAIPLLTPTVQATMELCLFQSCCSLFICDTHVSGSTD